MTPHADLVARLRAIASRFDMTSTERYEQDSEAFYAATGYMAPGKDVPMAIGGQNETERRAAHEAWIASRNRSQQQAIREAADALAALPPPADPQLVARLERAETALEHVRRQAGIWKQEARTQKATVDGVGAKDGGAVACCPDCDHREEPHPADPPALVALVREWQRKQRGCDIENTAAAYAELDIAEAELLAYPLPAAPPVPETPQGWQPIETAPKDGTVIDVWMGDADASDVEFYCGRSGTRRAADWSFHNGKFRPALGLLNPLPTSVQPTHWQPLPAAPAAPPQEDQ